MACSNDITTLTLPVLLMHEMTEVNHNTCVIDCGSCIWCSIELLYVIHVHNSHTVCNANEYPIVLWQKVFLTDSVTVGIFLMYVCGVKCECWMHDIRQSLQANVRIMCECFPGRTSQQRLFVGYLLIFGASGSMYEVFEYFFPLLGWLVNVLMSLQLNMCSVAILCHWEGCDRNTQNLVAVQCRLSGRNRNWM